MGLRLRARDAAVQHAGDYAEPSDINIKGAPNAYAAYALVDEGDEWTNISDQIKVLIRNLWGMEIGGDGWSQREVVNKNAYLVY